MLFLVLLLLQNRELGGARAPIRNRIGSGTKQPRTDGSERNEYGRADILTKAELGLQIERRDSVGESEESTSAWAFDVRNEQLRR